MNKSQLVDAVADHASLTNADAAKAVEGVLETVAKSLADGEKVTIPGFGTFEARGRSARTGRNPQTGESLEVPATTVPAFKAGADLKRRVSGR